jgi:methionine-rich copper-binding protein CopC
MGKVVFRHSPLECNQGKGDLMTSRRFKIVIFCLLLILFAHVFGWGQWAYAHAEYERSEPAANAVIPAAPAEVHIWFTQELFRRKGANVIEVSGPDGTRVDQDDTRIDDDDRKHAFVSLRPALPAGRYIVRWHNSSIEDGHEGSGEFSFTVKPEGGEAAPQASPPTVQQPAAATSTLLPSPTPAPQASGGLPCFNGIILGGVLLTIVTAGQRKSE